MKSIRHPALLFLALVASATALSAKIEAGPKGGRLLETEPHRTEFFVTPDRKVEIICYDDALKPVAPGTKEVAVIAEPAAGKVKLEMEKTATGFLSTAALPEGAPYRVVVQVRAGAGATPRNFRIDFNPATCGECHRAEYACICDGH